MVKAKIVQINKVLEKQAAMDVVDASRPPMKRRKRKVPKDDDLEGVEQGYGELVPCVADPSIKVLVPKDNRIDVVSLLHSAQNVLDFDGDREYDLFFDGNGEKVEGDSALMWNGDPILPLEGDDSGGASDGFLNLKEFPPLSVLKDAGKATGTGSGNALKKTWVKKSTAQTHEGTSLLGKECSSQPPEATPFVFGQGGATGAGGRKDGKSNREEPNGLRSSKGGNGKATFNINATPWSPGIHKLVPDGSGIDSTRHTTGNSGASGSGVASKTQDTGGAGIGSKSQPRPHPPDGPSPTNENTKQYSGLFKENRIGHKGFQLKFMEDIEDDVVMDEKDEVPFEDTWGYCLIGCFTGPFPGRPALDTIIASWNVKCRAIPYGKGWTIFKFLNDEDRLHVLHGGLYMAYGKTLMLKMVDKGVVFTDDLFMSVPTWVVLPDVPLSVWSESGLSKLASKIGIPIHSDQITKERSMMNYARCLVEVDVSKPPKVDIGVKMPNGKRYVQKVKYENYPSYCHHCRCFGHNHFTCETLHPELVKIVKKPGATNGAASREASPRGTNTNSQPMRTTWKAQPPMAKNMDAINSNRLLVKNPFDVLATKDDLIPGEKKDMKANKEPMKEDEHGWQYVGAKHKAGITSKMDILHPT